MIDQFTVLVVCTGNICRSPIGERLLRRSLDLNVGDDARSFIVRSAGTYAGHRGEPMQPGARAVLDERGVPADDFRATPLSATLIDEADLVLTAEGGHRDACVRLVPASLRRTFTVKEFARLLEPVVSATAAPSLDGGAVNDPTARARALVVAAASARTAQPAAQTHPYDDIDDPYGQPVAAFRRTADEVERAIGDWVACVAAPSAT